MARNTVWKSLRSLEARNLIKRSGKPFMGSTRYQILTPPIGANGIPVEEPIGANEIPIEQPPIGANETPPIGANEILQSAQMDSREGNPKNVIQRRKSNKAASPPFEPTIEERQFAQWFKSSLPTNEQERLVENWQTNFAKAHRQLVDLDKRTPEEIRRVCQWARTDSFWQVNFKSPSKLRERNKQGVLFYDVLLDRMPPSTSTSTSTSTSSFKTNPPPMNLGGRTKTITQI